jgi:hypothetical protein
MIQVSGSHRRTFTFPAELPLAFTYYSDLGRILPYLPHIFLVQAYRYDQFRMLYSTVELGLYHIRIFCDLEARLDEKTRTLTIQPLNGNPPVESVAGPRSATAQGFYSSKSVFRAAGKQTAIEFSLKLRADLLSPLGLRLMPGGIVNRIAHNITRRRIREIAEGFIERSIDAFPYWMDELQQENLPSL